MPTGKCGVDKCPMVVTCEPKGPEFVAAPQPKIGLDMGQAVYTAGTRPVGSQVTTIGHLSTPHLPVGMAVQPAQVNPSLVPPLVPTSVVASTLSTAVVPAYTMLTPSTSIATAMPSSSVVADTRPTYVSLGAPLDKRSTVGECNCCAICYHDSGCSSYFSSPCVSGPRDGRSTTTAFGYGKFCCRSTCTYSDNQATGTCPPIYWANVL